MNKILPFLFIFAVSQQLHAQTLVENEAPQMSIPGYSPPAEKPATPPSGAQPGETPPSQSEGTMPPRNAMPTQPEPPTQNAAPPPGVMPSTPPQPVSPPTTAPNNMQPTSEGSTEDFYANLAQCTKGNFQKNESQVQIFGWENEKCHVTMTSKDPLSPEAICYLSKPTIHTLTAAFSAFKTAKTAATQQGLVEAIKGYMGECKMLPKKPATSA